MLLALSISGIGGCDGAIEKVLPIGGRAEMPVASRGIGIGLLAVSPSAMISTSMVSPICASPDKKFPPASLVTLEICPVDDGLALR